MQTTNHNPTEDAPAPTDADSQQRSRPRRFMELGGAVVAVTALALLIAGTITVSAGAEGDAPNSGGNTAEVSYEQCVTAAFAALGPADEVSSEGSLPDAGIVDAVDPVKSQQAAAAVPDPSDVEQVHPNSPAHEMCTEDCPEDEQCPRPTEFTVVRDENVETISFENPDPQNGSAG